MEFEMEGGGNRSEAAHTFLNLPAWNNESSAYNKVERIVVDYKLSKKEVTLNRIGVYKKETFHFMWILL